MSENVKVEKCKVCGEQFGWLDSVVFVEGVNKHYHEKCVDLIPNKYTVFTRDGSEHLGDTEEVYSAYEIMEEGTFTEDD